MDYLREHWMRAAFSLGRLVVYSWFWFAYFDSEWAQLIGLIAIAGVIIRNGLHYRAYRDRHGQLAQS
jgi:hypothetical protein